MLKRCKHVNTMGICNGNRVFDWLESALQTQTQPWKYEFVNRSVLASGRCQDKISGAVLFIFLQMAGEQL